MNPVYFYCDRWHWKCVVVLFWLAGLRPSWRLGWKGLRPAATCSRRNPTPSPCASVRSFAKLSKSVMKRGKKSLFSSSRRVSKGGLVFFLSFRLRLKWERWWERPPSLWLKPNLQPETSGESRRRITWCIVFGTNVSVTLWIFNTVCSTTVIQNVNKAQVKVRAKKDNVAGQLKTDHLFTAHRRGLTSSYTHVSLCFRCHPSCFWALPRRRWQ